MSAAKMIKQAEPAERDARPFIKYAGGKSKLVPFILSHMPKKMNSYYEPMVGGGAVFFALANERAFKHANISDMNADLILTYKVVRHNPEGLIALLKKFKNKESFFLKVRADEHLKLVGLASKEVRGAARFIYLNKTCFNGMYRVNRKGEFNVPFGHYENPNICDQGTILLASKVLENVKIQRADFEVEAATAGKRDVVYFDPPYIPLSKTSSFTAYTGSGFGQAEHERLAEHFANLAKKGCTVLLSNSDTKESRRLYKGFKIYKTTAARSINSVGTKRGHVGEILVVANERP